MALSTIAVGLLLAVTYTGLEVLDILDKREREEFENS